MDADGAVISAIFAGLRSGYGVGSKHAVGWIRPPHSAVFPPHHYDNSEDFETDFPHPTSLYPGVQDKLVATLGSYDYETRKRVLQLNASELFNLAF